jgi:hypothetical protein
VLAFLFSIKKCENFVHMKRIIYLLVFAFALTVPCLSQPIPRFSQYPATVEKPRVKAINFKTSPDARSFRTRLGDGLREGVNFAGHYAMVGWGCGTGCISGAIVDTRTGNVYWPEQFNAFGVLYTEGNYAYPPVEYKKNSRLLVIHGIPGEKNDDAPAKPSGSYYYEWKNNRLRQVKFVPKPME